ncbi:glycosyltransferase [Terriglobus tenax]|uniref:glycosyltransferase n=1 Tax=Terriglobus tenax TaxID=1111115 RepID=UPI0021E03977|nr:glycosyltransferase [Terriglobus tenax]
MRPRVAYFPDSFHEVNGVAHTSRNFQAFATRHQLPFLCVRAGSRIPAYEKNGSVETLELKRSFASVPMERDLAFDTLFLRHLKMVRLRLQEFKPDIIHITGPSEQGILGAIFAWRMGIPLAASWHTNVHEYAARRAEWLTRFFSPRAKQATEQTVQDATLNATARFYRLAKVLFAPNDELCDLLATATGKPCHLMQRGVETETFSPAHRTRSREDKEFVLGFVGRLSVEKNVALLPVIQKALEQRGITNFRFLVIGHGAEEPALKALLPRAEFPGVLKGAALSEAYANMDLFVFPSHTDTFGNVVLEALASGVPAIVTPDGGPKYIVRDNQTGFIATDDGFPAAIERLLREPETMARMQTSAREYALQCSWDAVFERVYSAYNGVLTR